MAKGGLWLHGVHRGRDAFADAILRERDRPTGAGLTVAITEESNRGLTKRRDIS